MISLGRDKGIPWRLRKRVKKDLHRRLKLTFLDLLQKCLSFDLRIVIHFGSIGLCLAKIFHVVLDWIKCKKNTQWYYESKV